MSAVAKGLTSWLPPIFDPIFRLLRRMLYHHLGHEDLDVSDVRQTATYGERAKVLVGVAHIIGLVIILRKEF